MKVAGKVVGLTGVTRNLNKEIAGIKNRSIAGLLAAGLKIQGVSQRRVPVEHGDLRASAYTRKAQMDAMAVEVGFTAASALYLHENMQQKLKGLPRPSGLGVYWGPAGQPKFLESAVKDGEAETLRTIQAYAKVKR